MRFLKAWLPVIVWAAIILSAANDTFSDAHTAGWLERLFGSVPPEVNVLMRKTAHITEYAILALLAWRARRTFATPMLIVLVVASIDELLQSRTAARTGTPKDVALDLLGAALGLVAWYGLRRPLTRRFAAPSPRTRGEGRRDPSPREERGEGGRRPDEGN